MPQSQPRPQNYKGLVWVAAKFGTLIVFRSAVATFVLGSIVVLTVLKLHKTDGDHLRKKM